MPPVCDWLVIYLHSMQMGAADARRPGVHPWVYVPLGWWRGLRAVSTPWGLAHMGLRLRSEAENPMGSLEDRRETARLSWQVLSWAEAREPGVVRRVWRAREDGSLE